VPSHFPARSGSLKLQKTLSLSCAKAYYLKMKKILLTAFEPFGGETINPSQEVVRSLCRMTFDGLQIESCALPVERFKAIELALERIRRSEPDVVIMLGEAGGRPCITPERMAVNMDDFRIPDNAGYQPTRDPIVAGGPMEYFSTLPVDGIVEHLTQAHIHAALSNDAGHFLCNRLFYCVMHTIGTEALPMSAGFIHLPYLPEQVINKKPETPSMPLETMVHALTLIMDHIKRPSFRE
jgi:pyroglutamyl-peptidase